MKVFLINYYCFETYLRMNNFDKVELKIPDSFSDRNWMRSNTESLVLGFKVKSVPYFNYKIQ